ncbi:hypothetical protein JKP88DRAFT_282247 [Tribonema minus]|uniref:Uncharacterized protein n=1 Tax=Tribonema minus TaxID=303371 RepID=A0A835YTX1_9STRA|nr:hypothetical protein JKP88DRAFT_282247 [Tribonema minus]
MSFLVPEPKEEELTEDEGPRNMRAATSPIGYTAPSTPLSQILAQRQKEINSLKGRGVRLPRLRGSAPAHNAGLPHKVGAGRGASAAAADVVAIALRGALLLAAQRPRKRPSKQASGHEEHHHWSGTDSTERNTQSSNGGSAANKSDNRLTPRQLMRKYRAKVKPRTRLYIVFLMVELIMIAIFFAARHASHHAVIVNYADSATDALNGVHEGYTKKIFQMRNLLETSQYNWDLQAYMAAGGQTQPHADSVTALLKHVLNVYQVEYAVVLGADKKVLLSASAHNVGNAFNPEGVIDKAAADVDKSVWTYGILKYADLVAEDPPLFRDRESDLDEVSAAAAAAAASAAAAAAAAAPAARPRAFKGAHPYETQADSLIRWVAMAVRRMDMTTLQPLDPAEAPVGYFLLGDVPHAAAAAAAATAAATAAAAAAPQVNGKSASTSLIGLTLGGMGGIYVQRRNKQAALDAEPQTRWLTASATVSAALEATLHGRHTIQNMLVQGFSPFDSLPDKDAHMDTAQNKSDADKSALTTEISPFMQALRKWQPDDEEEPKDGRPPVTLARGLAIDTTVTTKFMSKQYIRLAVIVAVDLLTLFLATWLFLLHAAAACDVLRAGARTMRSPAGVGPLRTYSDAATSAPDASRCVAPLEMMGRRVRSGQRVDISFLRSLTKRRKLAFVIAAVAVFSVLVGVEIRQKCAANMEVLIRKRNEVERSAQRRSEALADTSVSSAARSRAHGGAPANPHVACVMRMGYGLTCVAHPGSTMLAYRQGMDQSLRILTSMQMCTALQMYLTDPNNQAALGDFLHQRLAKIESTLWVEMALLYDNEGKLLAVPRNRALIGQKFDPSGIVADTLAQHEPTRFTRSSGLLAASDLVRLNVSTWADSYYNTTTYLPRCCGLLAASDLVRLNVSTWVDRYYNTTPLSALRAKETGEQALVRWVAVPVWNDGLQGGMDGGPPDGVLVIGDVVNGKTRIVERANKMVNHGYSAVYVYNSTAQYQLVAGIMRTAGTLFDVDVPLPETGWLDAIRKSTAWHSDDHFTVTKTLYFDDYGGKFVVSARCVNKNTVVGAYGADVDPTDWSGGPLGDCQGFLIHGIPWHKVAPILAPCYAAQGTFVGMCCIKFVAMAILCYMAYMPFKKIVLNNKFVQSAAAADSASTPATSAKKNPSALTLNSAAATSPAAAAGRPAKYESKMSMSCAEH